MNQKLSQNRALAVEKFLESKGISTTRFTISGMGIADPIATNDTPEGRAQNRRVEFAITANSKMVNDAEKEAGK
jgi:outer membrane protein OmpA-like peptidoglycan-associated protein